jgi:hypothetical protein
MNASIYPPAPTGAALAKMIADTRAELRDPRSTERHREIVRTMISLLKHGHVTRDEHGKFRVTAKGVAERGLPDTALS